MPNTSLFLATLGLLVAQAKPVPGEKTPGSAGGELEVELIGSDGSLQSEADFTLVRMEDGKVAAMWSADRYHQGRSYFTGLERGRYRLEAENERAGFSATGYADVLDGKQTTLRLSLVPKRKFIARGRVTRGESGVAGADVWGRLFQWPQPLDTVARTGRDGRFEIEIPEPGDWAFDVRAPEWDIGERGWNILLAHYFVRVGFSPSDATLNFELPPGRLSGKLVGVRGLSIEGEDVYLTSEDPRGFWSRTTTDPAGHFEFRDLNPGKFWVSTGGPRVLERGCRSISYAFSCQRAEVSADESTAAEENLEVQQGGELECEFRDPRGRTVSGAWVYARPKGTPGSCWFLIGGVGEDGRLYSNGKPYAGNLPFGTLQIAVRDRWQGLATAANAYVKMSPGERTRGKLSLELATTLIIRGQDEELRPVFIRLVSIGNDSVGDLLVEGPERELEPLIRTEPAPAGQYILRVADAMGRIVETQVTVRGEAQQEVLIDWR